MYRLIVLLLFCHFASIAHADWRDGFAQYGVPPQDLTGLLEKWNRAHGGTWAFQRDALDEMEVIDAELVFSEGSLRFAGYGLCAKTQGAGRTKRALVLVKQGAIDTVLTGDMAEGICSAKRRNALRGGRKADNPYAGE